MENILRNNLYAGPGFILMIILLINCSDLPISPYDKTYKGNYNFTLLPGKDTLYPFTPYQFSYLSGNDSFASFSLRSDPPGITDSSFFKSRLTGDSMGFYFTSPFKGAVFITGFRPNRLCDTFSYLFSVRDPCIIKYIQIISSPDTIKSFVLSESPSFSENLKKIIWYLDTLPLDTLSITDTCIFPFSYSKDMILSACLIDWQNHQFFSQPCTLFIYQTRTSISFSMPQPLYTGDSIILSLLIYSQKNDSGSLSITSAIKSGIIPIFFKDSSFSLKFNLGVSDKPIIMPIKFVYINSKGFSFINNSFLNIEPIMPKPIIYGIKHSSPIIYENQPLSLSILFSIPAGDRKYDRYFWSFDGDSMWDTITSVPEIISSFRGDSLHLRVCCADSDNFSSNSLDTVFPIDPGLPVIEDIIIPEHNLFAGKPFKIKIWAHDNPGGAIDSFKIKFFNLYSDTIIFISDQSSFSVNIDTSFSGKVCVQAQVKDNSNHWSKLYIKDSITEISMGIPEILSFKSLDTVWLHKQSKLFLEAADYDGIISSVIINWDDSCVDTFVINESNLSDVFTHTYHAIEKHPVTVRATVIDSQNLKTEDSTEIIIHDGNPLIQAVTSSICIRNGNVLFVRDNQNPYNRTPVFDGNISFSMSSFDSNGTVIRYFCDIDSPYSISGSIGKSFTNLMSFDFCDYSSWFFTDTHPLVKSVIYAMDDDSLIGTDTVFITLDHAPSNDIMVLLPASDDTIRSSSVNYIWTGGIDKTDSLETRFSLVVNYHFDQLLSAYKDSLVFNGKLQDFRNPTSSGNQFKLCIQTDLRNNLEAVTPIVFSLTVSDRLGQTRTLNLQCYGQ